MAALWSSPGAAFRFMTRPQLASNAASTIAKFLTQAFDVGSYHANEPINQVGICRKERFKDLSLHPMAEHFIPLPLQRHKLQQQSKMPSKGFRNIIRT